MQPEYLDCARTALIRTLYSGHGGKSVSFIPQYASTINVHSEPSLVSEFGISVLAALRDAETQSRVGREEQRLGLLSRQW